jgi:dynein light chain Tctex-type 1
MKETTTNEGETAPAYKFIVNSTIIQHSTSPSTSETSSAGRRGMHSAAGAYWNNEKDGMWSYKYEGGEAKGMDVVLMVMWVAM